MTKTIIVIGAGAAGLMAAISAARSGANVTILEAQEKPGRKLLVTGNGRCNLTNQSQALAGVYHGTGAVLASRLLREFDADATLAFFHDLGLLTQEKNGCIYPYTAQAGSVLEVLLSECRRLKVKLKFSQEIIKIELHTKHTPYSVVTPTWSYPADAVILACGSKAAPSTGASDKGYLLAQRLGHTVIAPRPALVPLTCHAPFLNRLAGVRCRASVALLHPDSPNSPDVRMGHHTKHASSLHCQKIAEDTGELQWTTYGVSGIVIFQLSRFFDPEKYGDDYILSIDLLPDYKSDQIETLLIKRAAELAKEPVSVLLRGFINEKLIPVILGKTGQFPKTCNDLDVKTIAAICHLMKDFRLPVSGTRAFDQAQICAGGIDCHEISDTLESRLHSGLYFAGEMLDVDGPCGGYNLQWAWTSGYLAGKSAAQTWPGTEIRNR
ncbi:MAG: aminoacetone oxidase family FAD-binding enzyme [Clostridiales bacterium]|nr:aminoacetone oxidase family FAD-binding enzyme [Clostridiales bacterium]